MSTHTSSNLDMLLLLSLSPKSGDVGVCLLLITLPFPSSPFRLNNLSFCPSLSNAPSIFPSLLNLSPSFLCVISSLIRVSVGDLSCFVDVTSCLSGGGMQTLLLLFVVSGLCSIVNCEQSVDVSQYIINILNGDILLVFSSRYKSWRHVTFD